MRYCLIALLTVLMSACAYLETNSRLQQFDDLQRGYARAMTWSDLAVAYSATRAAENKVPANALSFQDIKITAYEPINQKVEDDGQTIRRTARIRFVFTSRMAEQQLLAQEEWRYSENHKRWILESGFPAFRESLLR